MVHTQGTVSPAVLFPLALWYGVIFAKFAVLVMLVRRRIPAFAFGLFFLAHAVRSLYLIQFQADPVRYQKTIVSTEAVINGLAIAAAVEAFLLITWRLPDFRWPGSIAFVLLATGAAVVALGAGRVLAWQVNSPAEWTSALVRTVGIGLAVFLGAAVLLGDTFRDVDKRALYHAASLTLASFAAAAAHSFYRLTNGQYEPTSSFISSGGALLAYIVWIKFVTGIDLSRVQIMRAEA